MALENCVMLTLSRSSMTPRSLHYLPDFGFWTAFSKRLPRVLPDLQLSICQTFILASKFPI